MQIPQWLVSSANPQNISLLIKGLATLLVLLGADAAVVSQLQNDVMNLAVKILEIVAVLMSVWGGFRKIHIGRWSAPKPNYSDEGYPM